MIVQISALRTGHKGWFEDYAVLGDDIVIADKTVAQSYLFIMEILGVDINLSKSVQSSIGACEFAKKLIIRGDNLSSIGIKELFLLISSPRHFKDLLINNDILSLYYGSEEVGLPVVSGILNDLFERVKAPLSQK